MVRQFRIIRRRIKSLSGTHGYSFVIAMCLALIAGNSASALPGTLFAGTSAQGTPPILERVGVCPNGSYGCADYPADREDAYEAPPPGVYYKPAPPAAEPPCDEVAYAAHPRAYLYTEGVPAPRHRYAAPPPEIDGYVRAPSHYREYEDCGVRCWYQRLREGYCGRGCDYYRYRLKDFPEGKLVTSYGRRLACQTAY